jgi:formylglycine-generating enzyme required for sulfatase activity
MDQKVRSEAMGDKVSSEAPRRALASGAREVTFHVGRAEFVLTRIPAGAVAACPAGSAAGANPPDNALRGIRVSRPFYLGKFEVTQLQFAEIMGEQPSRFHGDSLPADDVRYSEAVEFCERLSRAVGVRVTLPTEDQWEYACRAGTNTRYYSGQTEAALARVAWYRGNSHGTPHTVGTKEPNALGLYDMLGNVWEPCREAPPSNAVAGRAQAAEASRGVEGMMRGGGWQVGAEDCSCASRLMSNDMFGGMGIRIALNVDADGRAEQVAPGD